MYSVRMRAAKGGAHELGGLHISGAERLAEAGCLGDVAKAMIERALTHAKGKADFIRLTIDEVADEVRIVPLPMIKTIDVRDEADGLCAAKRILEEAGVAQIAAERAIAAVANGEKNMRGAMAVAADTGQRVDGCGDRGIRVSRMDSQDEQALQLWLSSLGLTGIHVREAVVLAAKVMAAPDVAAELCWSDDPGYVAGYVAAGKTYHRITKLKQYDSARGGRIFFVKPGADIEALRGFLERQTVLAALREAGR